MNILFVGPYDKTMGGVSHALSALGQQVASWDVDINTVDATFYELRPAFVFVDKKRLFPELLDALKLYGSRIILGCSDGIIPDGLEPDLVLSSIDTSYPTYFIAPGADLTQHQGVIHDDKMSCKTLYLSVDRIEDSEYKNFVQTHADKIVGPRPFDSPKYIGNVTAKEFMQFLAAADIVLDFNLNVLYDAALQKTAVISNQQTALSLSLAEHAELVSSEKYRRSIVKKNFKEVRENHTYFHRVRDMGELLDVPEWQDISIVDKLI